MWFDLKTRLAQVCPQTMGKSYSIDYSDLEVSKRQNEFIFGSNFTFSWISLGCENICKSHEPTQYRIGSVLRSARRESDPKTQERHRSRNRLDSKDLDDCFLEAELYPFYKIFFFVFQRICLSYLLLFQKRFYFNFFSKDFKTCECGDVRKYCCKTLSSNNWIHSDPDSNRIGSDWVAKFWFWFQTKTIRFVKWLNRPWPDIDQSLLCRGKYIKTDFFNLKVNKWLENLKLAKILTKQRVKMLDILILYLCIHNQRLPYKSVNSKSRCIQGSFSKQVHPCLQP